MKEPLGGSAVRGGKVGLHTSRGRGKNGVAKRAAETALATTGP